MRAGRLAWCDGHLDGQAVVGATVCAHPLGRPCPGLFLARRPILSEAEALNELFRDRDRDDVPPCRADYRQTTGPPLVHLLGAATVTTGFPHRGCDLNRRKAISERLAYWLHARLYLSLSLRAGGKRERFDNRVGRYVLAKFTLTATVMGKRQWRVAKSGRMGWRSSGSS